MKNVMHVPFFVLGTLQNISHCNDTSKGRMNTTEHCTAEKESNFFFFVLEARLPRLHNALPKNHTDLSKSLLEIQAEVLSNYSKNHPKEYIPII